MIEDGKYSSLTIAASPDDGTGKRACCRKHVRTYECSQDSAEDVHFLDSVLK